MSSNQRFSPDLATVAGLLIAGGSVVGGLILEGGSIRDIAQPSAALMVVGGTLGAVLISTPLRVLLRALRSLRHIFTNGSENSRETLDEILRLSTKARKSGIPSLEADALACEEPFFRKALTLAVDLTPLAEIRAMMEIDLDLDEGRLITEAKVFETAGGYAPTVGIIGAVLGLIQVMKHLENIDEVGRGIAVAFVATVYGVALANLALLPAAAKLRAHAAHLTQSRELALEGIVSIVESSNPTLLRLKLEPYVLESAQLNREDAGSRPHAQPFAEARDRQEPSAA